MSNSAEPRLELTWHGKDKFLLSPKDESGKPIWVERDHPAASEVRLTDFTGVVGETSVNPYADNLLFTGDSLDMLRVLDESPEFRQEYRGKIKLVYIDPPFNTGQTFTHYDDWMDHSTWLSFMRERLLLIKDLLAPDGSVWVHLDDAEQHRMRCLLDEVFGGASFQGHIVWQKADSPRSDAKGFSVDQDHILIYSRQPMAWTPNRLPRTAEMDSIYSSPDGDPEPWFDDNPTAPSGRTHQGMVYAIQSPFTGELQYPAAGRCWSLEQSRMMKALEEWAPYEARDIDDSAVRAALCGLDDATQVRPNVPALMLKGSLADAQESAQLRRDAGLWPEIIFRSRGGVGRKRYRPTGGIAPRTLWLNDVVGHNRTAKAEIKALFPGKNPFSTPKPERLLQQVIRVGSNPGDTVLDCFGGSGTTAAVAHKMGRRWVTCEILPETVAAFTKPRLEMVVKGDDGGGISQSVEWSGGGGFRGVEIAASMYELTDFGVVLADWATNGRFARAVAGQLGFKYEPDSAPFSGTRGRMRLAVFDGVVGPEEIRQVVADLGEKERVTVVAQAVVPGTEELLAELSKGSRVRKAPRDLLTSGARRARRRTGGTPA